MTDDNLGRPPKGDGPAFPHEEVDHILVHGETIEDEATGRSHVHYPSYRELAERYGVAHSLIGRFAREHNCLARRKKAEKRVRDMADEMLAKLRAEELVLSREDSIRCIDRFLVEFEVALSEGRVRCDNPSDYNLMTRLKAFLLGEADSRHEEIYGITLEDMQAAHARLLKAEEQMRLNPALTGMVYPGSTMLGAGRFGGDDGDDGDDGSDGGSPMLS